MTTRLISAATAVMVFTLLIAGNTWAQDFDPCAGLTGKAKGLCMAYATGMRCSADVPLAAPEACANVATMLEEVTGFPPPSDCPCDFSLARIRDPVMGWDSAGEYICNQQGDFDRTLPPPASLGGSDVTWLWTVPQQDLINRLGYIGSQVRTVLTGADKLVNFSCHYGSAADPNLQGVFFEAGRGGPRPYAEMVAEFIDKYEACKGAIGILVANFPFDLSRNECSFN